MREPASRHRLAAAAASLVLALGSVSPAAAPWGLKPEAERLLAPDFVLPDLAGGRWHLYEFRGRPVLINFAATWCLPCRDELPALSRLQRQQGPGGLQVVAVFVDRTGRVDVAPLAEELALPFPVLLDPRGVVLRVYRVRALPTTFLVDSRGRVARTVVGAMPWDTPAVGPLLAGLALKDPSLE